MKSANDIREDAVRQWYAESPAQRMGLLCLINRTLPTAEIHLPSLRQIDFFIVNYARRHQTNYWDRHHGRQFYVYAEYRAELKAYTKDNFDPFKRGPKLENGSTLCQMNFFRWAISHDVIAYMMLYMDEILEEMSMASSAIPHTEPEARVIACVPEEDLFVVKQKTVQPWNQKSMSF